MKALKVQGFKFVIWLSIGIISMLSIIFTFFKNIILIFSESFFPFVLMLFWLSFSIIVISVYEIFTNLKNKINNKKENEKTAKDIYRYQQLLDPPDADTNN